MHTNPKVPLSEQPLSKVVGDIPTLVRRHNYGNDINDLGCEWFAPAQWAVIKMPFAAFILRQLAEIRSMMKPRLRESAERLAEAERVVDDEQMGVTEKLRRLEILLLGTEANDGETVR